MRVSMDVVIVPAARAEDVRRALRTRDLINGAVRMRKRAGEVHIPVVRRPPADMDLQGGRVATMDDLEPRGRPRDPRGLLADRLVSSGIPPNLMPRHWERIGDVVVVRLPRQAAGRADAIGRVLGETLGAQTVVEDRSGVHGPTRIPEVRVLWGDGTETAHLEGGVRYKLDVARVMFSSGNLAERMSIAERIRAGEVVVDLFAGIGYFAMPIAVRARPARVFACELSPVAFGYLLENIRLNRTDRVVPILGDCRKTAPHGVADWVLMGHFDALDYVDVGLACLRGKGTLLVHGLVPKERFPEGLAARVRSRIERLDASADRILTRKVKSFAPGVVHGVVEVHATSVPKGISRERQ